MGLKKPLEKKHLRALRGVKDKQKFAQTQPVQPPPLKAPLRPSDAPTSVVPDVPSVKPYPLPQPPSQPGVPPPPPVMVTPGIPVPPAKPPRIAGPLAKTTMMGRVPTDVVPPPKAEAPGAPLPAPQAPVPPSVPEGPSPSIAKIEAPKAEAPAALPPITEPLPKPVPAAKIEAAKVEAPAVLPPIAEPLPPKPVLAAELPAPSESKETKPEAVSSAPSAPGVREARKVRLLKRKAAAAALLTTTEKPRRSFSIPVPVRIAAVVLFLAALGAGLYYYFRETQVHATVQSGDYVLSKDLLVVSDFSGRLNMLQRDFDRRRQPLLEEIRTEEGYLSASQAEWNGKKTKLKLLMDESARLKASIPEVIKENQKALDRLWNEKSAGLEKELEAKRTAIMDEIKAKAAALKLEKFNPNLEIPAVEVAVNAFRLALYSAPAGTKVDEERKWVEGLLNGWRDYEEDWREEQLAIRDEALKLKQAPGPQIEEINDRIASLQVEIDSLRVETSSLEAEVKRFEERLAEKKGELAAVEPPFYAELLAVPGEFTRMALPLQADGSLVLRDMDKDPRFTAEIPGKLTLMARATKDGEEFWALKEVELNQYKKNAWKIAPEDFYPARKHLKVSP
jgi:peptidoglycan hydrolase CwlO-like protein